MPLGQTKHKPSRSSGSGFQADYDERAIMRAWETFVTDGDDEASPTPHVRPLIKQSWHRCAMSAIDATRDEAPLAQSASGRSSSCGTQPRAARGGPGFVRRASAACSRARRRC